ncbi:hypothetical protein EXN66_Car001206 [Channa argus]|uniref:Uncharacterized protein n=1 Tax=Channa argus TaxID=215402 RepID=A0A6G1R0B8_CHAAH|nr:hypothetical protein EXN66_Car001206 [Channa argus]
MLVKPGSTLRRVQCINSMQTCNVKTAHYGRLLQGACPFPASSLHAVISGSSTI